jgi:hypothetical protein
MSFSRVSAVSLLLGALYTWSGSSASAAPATPSVVRGGGSSAGGLFTAGAEGAEFLLPSGATVRVFPHAAVRLFGRPQALELGPGGKTQTWSLALSRGRVDVVVPAKPKSAVLVSIERVSAVITAGSVTVLSDSAATAVVNSSGAAKVLIENRWSQVEPGHVLEVNSAHPAGADSKLLEGPVFEKGNRIWFTAGEPAALGGFAWRPVAGATRFDIELRQGQKVLAGASVSEPKLARPLTRVGPGEYELALRSVDARDIPGPWSAPVPLRVVGVELPPGAYEAGGGIYLSGGQKLHFSHTGGLEMTYVGAGKYVPASSEVGLYRNQRTIVSFRYPSSGDHAIARLEPRDVYAEVFAGPKLATWPKNPIELTVRLRTRAGVPVPSFIEVVPKVLVGVEPIDVAWRRTGSELHAIVPPQASEGPWVIRVDVADQFGIPLGRDFVEVAAGSKGRPHAEVGDNVVR